MRTKIPTLAILTGLIVLSLWSINMKCASFHQWTNEIRKCSWVDRLNCIFPYSPTTADVNVSLSKPLYFGINEFFMTDLIQHPDEANKLSAMLTNRRDVIKEAQRIHMNIFSSLLGRYKYAMLFDYSPFENKGDSAISVGEVILLRKLNIEVVFACAFRNCTSELNKAQNISKNYTNKELVILFQGGGNVIGWPVADELRASEIPRFMEFHIVMFPQSILYIEPKSHIDFCKRLYASHNNLTFVWRDKHSYKLGKNLFPKVQSLLAPDMAYQIGYVSRYMHPTQDILWIRRTDKESPSYELPPLPAGDRVHVSDWRKWETPEGTSPMEDIFLKTIDGMTFLQRRRIVITDRLHGHILSTLLGIPHVYIDNKQRKISNYHNTWTASVDNIILANSSADAVFQAIKMLTELDKDLPRIKTFYSNTN